MTAPLQPPSRASSWLTAWRTRSLTSSWRDHGTGELRPSAIRGFTPWLRQELPAVKRSPHGAARSPPGVMVEMLSFLYDWIQTKNMELILYVFDMFEFNNSYMNLDRRWSYGLSFLLKLAIHSGIIMLHNPAVHYPYNRYKLGSWQWKFNKD